MAKMSAENLLSCSLGFPDSVMIIANAAIKESQLIAEKSLDHVLSDDIGIEVRNKSENERFPLEFPTSTTGSWRLVPDRISGMSPNNSR